MFWNQKDLPQPPVNTYKVINSDLDLKKLQTALQDGINHFKNQKFLSIETNLLYRILYRMKMKFRNGKDFKLLEKMHRCLKNYFSTRMNWHLQNLLDLLPKTFTKNECYVPSKNMLLYILVRLQGLVKLLEHIYNTCLLLAEQLQMRLGVGHFWKLFFILFAIVSRISVIVKANTRFLCELYGKLLPHSYKLSPIGVPFLPDGYELPTDLREWLSVSWVYEEDFVDLTFEPPTYAMDILNLIDNDDDDNDVMFCDEYILLEDEKDGESYENNDEEIYEINDSIISVPESPTPKKHCGKITDIEDVGIEIVEHTTLNYTGVDSILLTKKKKGKKFPNNRNEKVASLKRIGKTKPTKKKKKKKKTI
ncbi:hypothetical protein ABEB36_014245 [Hypothenemus hampei]|uniref:Nucleolus and neural progenitor protein-like N-terminal domain-containing protein n=1 Tax=Hypothenemus hampei TaxID=57062 RepID=A0ABD1E3T5_HYPHA